MMAKSVETSKWAPTPAITDREVARWLGVSLSTVRSWRLRRTGPRYVKFGRAVRYRRSDIDSYLRASVVE